MSIVHPSAVGLPGVAIFLIGALAFIAAVFTARRRRALAGAETVAERRSASWAWIAVQGIGVGIAGFGPLAVTLDPAAPPALGEALAVALLIGAAIWLFHAASRTMGANWSLVARTRDDHALVRVGPFAYVRHPIYVAIFLLMLAMAVAYGHIANLIVAVPVYALGTWMRIGHEERLLRQAFGTAYDEYARDVKRFVPGLF